MARFVDIYRNSHYCGFTDIESLNEQFLKFEKNAEKILDYIDWDEIVLYAVYKYDNKSNSLISADFMMLRMNKEKYINLAKKFHHTADYFSKRI